MTGPAARRVIGVVGPSGVGKDSVMRGLTELHPHYRLVRRVITRAPELGGEAFEPVDNAEFEAREKAGVFCLSWNAHGLQYGIPESVRARAWDGTVQLVNLSRSVLMKAQKVLPGFGVLNITASPETLAARLTARGRESSEDIKSRLARTVPLPIDRMLVLSISNDGALDATVAAAHRLLSAPQAFPDGVKTHLTGS